MTAITYLPNLADACDRIIARDRAENIAAERAEAIDRCKAIIDNPRGYTDDQLREVCGFYMTYGDGGVHYLLADEHIFAINNREFQARNCPPLDDAREHHKQLAAMVLGGLAVVALVTMGWV